MFITSDDVAGVSRLGAADAIQLGKPMDLNALETFIDVVRAGSFSAATRRASMPRSSVSLRIRNLEKALGFRLFKRSTRAFARDEYVQEALDNKGRIFDFVSESALPK